MRFFIVALLGLAAAMAALGSSSDGFHDREVYVVYMGSRQNAASDALFASQKSTLMNVFSSEVAAFNAVVYSYRNAFNGFAAWLTDDQAHDLAGMPGVVSVFKSRNLALHTTHSWEFLGVSNRDFYESWANSDNDVIVGVLDTGIWPESDSFRDHGMGPVPNRWRGVCENTNSSDPIKCNRKVIGLRSYYDGSTGRNSTALEFTNARDSVGHGSHTASTCCGREVRGASLYGILKGNARGGLPKARIAVYKVCFYGNCLDHSVLAAFDDAVKDGVDILSVSLGGPPVPFHRDSIAIGSFHAVKHGILVACSAGNSGPFPLTVTNVVPWVLTVGSTSANRKVASFVKLGNNQLVEGAGLNIKKMSQEQYGLVYAGHAAISKSLRRNASFCLNDSLDGSKVRNRIVLCKATLLSGSRVGNASSVLRELGAAGVVQVNDFAARVAFSFALPFTIVESDGGRKILSYLNSTKHPRAVILPTKVIFDNETRETASMSVFSSRGPSRLGFEILKPDLVAPGENILAAWTPVKPRIKGLMGTREGSTVFNIVSGTSMSCPHVAGAAAYVKSVRPDWSPSMVKSALMTTASSKGLKEFNGEEAGPFDYGNGEMNPIAAVDPGLVYDIPPSDYVLYLCALGYNTKNISIITGNSKVHCSDKFRPEDLNYPTVTVLDFVGKKRVVKRTVTNVGPPNSTYRVVVEAPKGVKLEVVPSELKFSTAETKQCFEIQVSSEKPFEKDFVFGSLTWEDVGGRSVTSNILVVGQAKR